MSSPNRRRFLTLAAATGLLAWVALRNDADHAGPGGSDAADSRQTFTERLSSNLQIARGSQTKTDSKTSLAEMKKALRQMDVQEARAWILRELEEAEDFATQLDLTIGTDQNLAEWPSYRVFLLDMLYLVDPALAAEKSRALLQPAAKASADEWAVAMRNLARGSTAPADLDLLKTKSAEMLRREEWKSKPSSGFLEAFDVIVHTQNTALAPDLLGFCDARDERAVRHAAYLTLDRLVMAQPEKMLPELSRHATEHPQSRLMISNMVARADVRDAAQRKAVEDYLLQSERTPDELRGFASVFPNANVAVSQNLLTRSATIDGTDLAAQDRVALDVLAAWLADARFQRAHEPLREAFKRLEGFVGGRR